MLDECCARAQQILNTSGTPTNAHLLGVHALPPAAHAPHVVALAAGIPASVTAISSTPVLPCTPFSATGPTTGPTAHNGRRVDSQLRRLRHRSL